MSVNTSDVVSCMTVSRGATNIAVYNYVYNLNSGGSINTSAPNPYNIYQIKEGTTLKAEYYYDALGRLSRENNVYSNQTITYSYDGNNNITSKTFYPYTAGNSTLSGGTAVSYIYGNTTYKDRLTSYNGQSITYNTFGNPLSYLGKTLTWTGRELSTYSNSGTLTIYKYNEGGVRLSKTTGSTVTSYLYNGSQLIRETDGADTVWYLYDQSGMIGLRLNGTTYYYVRNLQGDVTKIIDTSGTIVVSYSYDSWGKVLSVTGSLASMVGAKNPIRYRGYYYDAESNLYYLISRYYDPETGRFLSPDIVAEGGNLYAYCINDPINRIDENGYGSCWWIKVKKWFRNTGERIKTDIVSAYTTVSNGVTTAYNAVSNFVVEKGEKVLKIAGATIGAFVDAFEFELGIGAGLGGGIELTEYASIEGVVSWNFLQTTINNDVGTFGFLMEQKNMKEQDFQLGYSHQV